MNAAGRDALVAIVFFAFAFASLADVFTKYRNRK